MEEESKAVLICDICDEELTSSEHCSLYVQGVKEKLNCHAKCIGVFMKCKGDFHKLPQGKLRRAIEADSNGVVTIRNTGITLRAKQGRAIVDALKKSHEEGMQRIKDIAVDFYGLAEPAEGEFYSIDHDKQIVLMRKAANANEAYKIEKVSRDFIE